MTTKQVKEIIKNIPGVFYRQKWSYGWLVRIKEDKFKTAVKKLGKFFIVKDIGIGFDYNAKVYTMFIKEKKNPPQKAVEIYSDIIAIEAKKGKNSLWSNENFRHDFKEKGTKIYGLEDGSLLIKGKKRLWKKFKNYKKGIDY